LKARPCYKKAAKVPKGGRKGVTNLLIDATVVGIAEGVRGRKKYEKKEHFFSPLFHILFIHI
jgi:hypothetical protein